MLKLIELSVILANSRETKLITRYLSCVKLSHLSKFMKFKFKNELNELVCFIAHSPNIRLAGFQRLQ